jgi:hypothetical protein
MRNMYNLLKLEYEIPSQRPGHGRQVNIKMNLSELVGRLWTESVWPRMWTSVKLL